MARQPNTQDVSVDEIIASIRRIVADDDQANASSAADSVAAASPPVGEAGESRPRNAMEDMLNFPPVSASILGARTESRQPHVAVSEDADRKPSEQAIEEPQAPPSAVVADTHPEAKPRRPPKAKTTAKRATEQALLSRTAAAAVDREFEVLSQIVSGSWNARLDAMAREMMRPMLRVWLDRHLPKLVRQLVREEIARISGTSR
jgi:cell pole-organizing protein PopZ